MSAKKYYFIFSSPEKDCAFINKAGQFVQCIGFHRYPYKRKLVI